MPNTLVRGIAGGAIGTTALNATTYLDMALRGRPSSSVPSQDVETLADQAGIDLSTGISEDAVEPREEGLGALMGILTGVGVGAVYGLVRPLARGVPSPVAALAVALGAMAATDGITTLLGNANPKEWPASSWVMDLVPHLAYGAATVAGYEAFDD